MPVRSDSVGTEFEARRVEVDVRMLLAFAAGTGEISEYTFDDTAPCFVASRAFCAALEWPVIRHEHRARLLGLTDAEVARGVHVEQDSIFHGVIRARDKLRTTGNVTAVRQTTAGALIEYKLTTADELENAPVVTTWYKTILRGISVEGAGSAIETAPAAAEPPRSSSHFGVRAINIPIAREAAHIYTECSGIWNPIHTEMQAARKAGLPGTILHGTALWALAGRELVRAYAGGNPSCLMRLRARFRAPVVPPTVLMMHHCETGFGADVHFTMHFDDGRVAVSDGYAAFVPRYGGTK